MFLSKFATFLLICTTLGAESQLPEPIASTNDQDKAAGRSLEFGAGVDEAPNDPFPVAETNDDIFGDPRKMPGVGGIRTGVRTTPGQGYQPKGKLFGKQRFSVNDMVKNSQQGFESTERREVRTLVTSALQWDFEATEQEKQTTVISWRADHLKCSVPGDSTTFEGTYCKTLFETLEPTEDFVSVITIGQIAINGNKASVALNVHVYGTFPVIGDVDMTGKVELVVHNISDGEWQIAEFHLLWENSGGAFDMVRSQIPVKRLADSISFAKQHFPGYNPIAIVGGSAVGGLFAITIVVVWIFRKRSPYGKVNTVADV